MHGRRPDQRRPGHPAGGVIGNAAAQIREATADDAEGVAALWTEAYVTFGVGGRTAPYARADFFESAEHGEIFVIEARKEIAGAIVLLAPGSPGRAVAEDDEAELARLAVAVPARGTGIGRALTVFCGKRARANGWPAIALWSRPAQVEAHRLYESLGYHRLPERDSIDDTGHGRLVFRLTLS